MISIHLMLRFNFVVLVLTGDYVEFQYILCYGSTQFVVPSTKPQKGFQYILCYGSTLPKSVPRSTLENFNTSYVTVQRLLEWLGLCLILNFNTSYVTVQHIYRRSRGIKDPISIHLMLRFNHPARF